MESTIELLKGATQCQVSVSSSEPPIKSLGEPAKKTYYTWQDVSMISTSFLCLLIGILAVANVWFAGYLGQKNQLIAVGLLLSLMAACLQKQVQLLLIALETRFGASTLQNYDSILRYSMLDANVNVFLKAAIVFLFALPLGLSASYKQFVSGTTALPMDPAMLEFGPVGAPGLVEGILSMFLNASLPLLVPNIASYESESYLGPLMNQPAKNASFGFNVQIVSDKKTALLDAPLASELTRLKGRIEADETLEISTYVNATICTLNSTRESEERIDHNYWRVLNHSVIDPPFIATYGTGLSFAVAVGAHDHSFIMMSLWDTRKNETYESEAVGFNLYRGQCNATWQITPEGTTTLKNASDCTAAPEFSRPCMGNEIPHDYNVKNLSKADALQAPLTCNSKGVGSVAVWPMYDLLCLQPVYPVWVAAVASMSWAELAFRDGPSAWALQTPHNVSAWETTNYTVLKYKSPAKLTKIVQTLHRDRGTLYLVLAIQPLLLLASFLARVLLFSTPVSSGFGLVALLAGVSKDSLDVLRGAAFSGELRKPVRIRISTVDRVEVGADGRRGASVEYELDSQGRHDRVFERKTYG